MSWTIEHWDENEDGIDECVVVLSDNYGEPLIGDYRGVQMAKIRYTPSRPDSIRRATEIAEMLVAANNAGTGIVGKMFLVESGGFEGLAEVLSVNNDDTVNVRSDYTGAIHIVTKDDLSEWIPESATYQETARACFFLKEDPWGAGAANTACSRPPKARRLTPKLLDGIDFTRGK